MLLTICNLLDSGDLTLLRADLERIPFVDGRATAGWSARLVKQNAQADADPLAEHWCARIAAALAANDVFRLAAQPKRLIGPMLSRYQQGDHYGTHVDDALLDGIRADIAFTLFLSDPASYDGGALVIDSPSGEDAHKLEAGCAVLYPATSLHRVEPVTSGTRHAAVGWVRSLIRSAEQRELLFDLETARRMLFDRHGKTPEFDLLAKTAANLMRMWCED
jgi:PKHD-type hydroxylase